MSRITLIGCLILFYFHAAGAQPTLDLQALIEEALANNPSLSALRHRWEVEQSRIPQAGALEDPLFKFELVNVPTHRFDFDSTPMSGKQFALSQKLPFPGKLRARERMAEHLSARAEAAYDDREGIIVNLVKQAYFSLIFLDRAIQITRENEDLLRDFIRIAQTKYGVGRGLQQDVLKAQVELSGLKDHLIALRQQRRHSEARLNTVLNRLPQSPVGRPDSLVPTPFVQSVEELQQTALAQRPQLRGIQEQIQRWKTAEELARKEYWPDFKLNLGYRQREFIRSDPVKGSDFFTVGLTLNLPIYRGRKQDQQVREAQVRRKAAEAEYQRVKQQIFMEIQNLSVDVHTHGEEAELFRTAIIPQADQALNSAMAGYEVDQVDFLTLLDNQVTLFDFEIEYYDHLTSYEKSLAELEAVVGKRLF